MRIKIAVALLFGLAGGAFGNWLVSASEQTPEPEQTSVVRVTGLDCPAEDSCAVDYRDNTWFVYEVGH